ncbi:MAG: hypothetical protein WA294_12295 [Acidobacteriaceae bacterium]
MEQRPGNREVDRFIVDEIESVPHLEALLLLWRDRPRSLSLEDLARSLYLQTEATEILLHDLERRGFILHEPNGWTWNEQQSRAGLMADVDATYRRELVRISSMIHSKASPAVRQFARAFRLKKD